MLKKNDFFKNHFQNKNLVKSKKVYLKSKSTAAEVCTMHLLFCYFQTYILAVIARIFERIWLYFSET